VDVLLVVLVVVLVVVRLPPTCTILIADKSLSNAALSISTTPAGEPGAFGLLAA